MKISLLTLSAVATLAMAATASAQTVAWNFTDGDAVADTVSPTLSLANVPSLVQGNNNGTTTLITATSPSSGYAGASGTNNAGAAARTGILSIATAGSAYFEFTLSPSTGFQVQATGLSLGERSTSTGPQLLSLRSSVDSFASDLSTVTVLNTSVWALYNLPAFTITGAADTPVTFRLYGSNGAGTGAANTANFRVDDINFSATTIASANVPEPSTYAMMAGAFGLLLVGQRIRRTARA